jgi:flagellar protein FlaG
LQGAPQIPAPAGRAAAGTSAEQARRQAEAIAKQLQEFVRSTARDLEFRVDEATGRAVVAVRNSSTGELIRQMPSEEALRILQHLNVGQPTVLDRTV